MPFHQCCFQRTPSPPLWAGGTRVDIGRENAMVRLQRMANSWERLRALRGVAPAGVDLRYANGFAVRWPEALGQDDESLADNR